MGYSPWGRKESDMTERLHSLHSLAQPAAEISRRNPLMASLLCEEQGSNQILFNVNCKGGFTFDLHLL